MSADDIGSIIRDLLPGFVALKVFYWFGIQSRRSDLEWTVWSILVAVAINAFVDRLISETDPTLRLLITLVAAVGIGWIAAKVWRDVARRNPLLRAIASRRAWDMALSPASSTPYISVWTTGGRAVYGWPESVASSADVDDVDLIIRDPEWVDDDGVKHPMDGVEGVLIPGSAIELVQIHELGELLDDK